MLNGSKKKENRLRCIDNIDNYYKDSVFLLYLFLIKLIPETNYNDLYT